MGLKETYNHIAEDWHKDHLADDRWVEGTNAFIELLPQGGSILDVGCAGGIKSKYFLERGFSATGIDISERFIEIAKRENPGGDFRVVDLADIPVEITDEYDGAFMQAVLLHIPKAEAGERVKGIAQKIKPGGYLYVAVKAVRPGQEEEQVVMEDDYGYEYERFFSFYSPEEIRGYLTDTGMKIVYEDIPDTDKPHWIQIIGKREYNVI